MIAAVIGALALAATITGLLIWQSLRAAGAKDTQIKVLKEKHKLERQVDAQSRAIEDRDHAVQSLESTLASEKARSARLLQQLTDANELLVQVKPNEVSHALRSALERYHSMLQVPEAEEG